MVVRSGTTVTAGAALSHIDLALALIRQTSPELASLVANTWWSTRVPRSRPTQSRIT